MILYSLGCEDLKNEVIFVVEILYFSTVFGKIKIMTFFQKLIFSVIIKICQHTLIMSIFKYKIQTLRSVPQELSKNF